MQKNRHNKPASSVETIPEQEKNEMSTATAEMETAEIQNGTAPQEGDSPGQAIVAEAKKKGRPAGSTSVKETKPEDAVRAYFSRGIKHATENKLSDHVVKQLFNEAHKETLVSTREEEIKALIRKAYETGGIEGLDAALTALKGSKSE